MASGTFLSFIVVLLGIIFPVRGTQVSEFDVFERLDNLEMNLAKQLESLDAQLKSLQSQLTKLTEERERDVIVRDIISAINRGHFRFVEENFLQMGDRVPISDIVYQVYGGSESNFDLLINLTQSLTNVEPSCQILSILYDEMKKNDHLKDIKNLVTLAKAFERCRINNIDAGPIEDNIEEEIVSRASELLIAAMESKKNYKYNEGAVATREILEDSRPDVVATVMERTVDGAFKTVDREKILKAVNSHKNLWQRISGIKAFFRQLKAAGPLQSSIVMTIASHLGEIRKQPEYAALDSNMRTTAESLLASLPACARNLISLPSFCVYNSFQKSYLAATGSIFDHERRHVFTVREKQPTGISWRVKMTNKKLIFDNADYPGEYIYDAARNYDYRTRYVFGWIPDSDQPKSQTKWNLELDGDSCYLKNDYFDEYLFASDVQSDTNDYGDDNFHFVFSMKKEEADNDLPFIWQIKEC